MEHETEGDIVDMEALEALVPDIVAAADAADAAEKKEAARVAKAAAKKERNRKAGDWSHVEGDGSETPNGIPRTEKNPGGRGRPQGSKNKRTERITSRSKYTEEMPDLILAYFNHEFKRVKDKSPDTLRRLHYRLPSFGEFARQQSVLCKTVYAWEEEHEEFAEAMFDCRQLQSEILMIMVTLGGWNSTFSLAALKQLCNWADKNTVEHAGEATGGYIVYLSQEDKNA